MEQEDSIFRISHGGGDWIENVSDSQQQGYIDKPMMLLVGADCMVSSAKYDGRMFLTGGSNLMAQTRDNEC